jgi:hypothetical protein
LDANDWVAIQDDWLWQQIGDNSDEQLAEDFLIVYEDRQLRDEGSLSSGVLWHDTIQWMFDYDLVATRDDALSLMASWDAEGYAEYYDNYEEY